MYTEEVYKVDTVPRSFASLPAIYTVDEISEIMGQPCRLALNEGADWVLKPLLRESSKMGKG